MFEELVGQKIAVRMLQNELKRDRLPQTMLFYGPERSEKFFTALELARVLNCRENGAASCRCASCIAVRRLSSPAVYILSKSNLEDNFSIWKRYGVTKESFPLFYRDVVRLLLQKEQYQMHLVEDTSSKKRDKKLDGFLASLREMVGDYEGALGQKDEMFYLIDALIGDKKGLEVYINDIRNLQRFLYLKSGEYKAKVAIIDGADHMNEESANSFLKISEDPPANTVIIMTAVDRKRIKPTILSRSGVYRFLKLNRVEEKKRLYSIYKREFADAELEETEDDRLLYFLKELSLNRDNYDRLVKIVSEILEESYEEKILNYLIDSLSSEIRKIGGPEIQKIYYIENRLKKLYDEKVNLRDTNVNRELSFLNFVLNELY